ncbi:hypothetical protein J2S55_008118 [Streptosporangium brasiliense]|uniref:Uncharacterized protein n=1 Tax=Streptosporangium brasiliense TaxID=47480 RepID=A0ABT9RJ49_9ACTN|nr:hypothetical protein [Streptosporangium brasiliense]
MSDRLTGRDRAAHADHTRHLERERALTTLLHEGGS